MQLLIRQVRAYPFLALWLIITICYLPAWNSGFVTDAIDWLYDANTRPFREYLNRTHSTVKSLYQLTQLLTLGIYKLFGTARIPWFLLMTGMQALNGFLLFRFFRRLFFDSGIKNAGKIAACGSLLACLSPYLSEVLVWKACFHYPLALVFILSILLLFQQFVHQNKTGNAIWAAVLFALSSFSLELFYLTPVFTATLIVFYAPTLRKKLQLNIALLFFLVPQVLIFAGHLLLFHLWYGDWISHSNGAGLVAELPQYASKGVKYLFHLLLLGRFWPESLKTAIYKLCENAVVIADGYIFLAFIVIALVKSRKHSPLSAPALLLLIWCIASTALILPMPFEVLFDMSGNRYLYLSVCFSVIWLVLLVSFIRIRVLKYALSAVWILCSSYFLLRCNRHWQTSTRVSNNLLKTVPAGNGRAMIFLSLPYCYKGCLMINAYPYGNFQRTHNVLMQPPISGKTYDVAAFNMNSPNDGSDAEWVNDSTVKVTLRQWGTWWWYRDFGAMSYENEDYRLDMRDQGHWYELVLKRPAKNYLLLYQQGSKWVQLPSPGL